MSNQTRENSGTARKMARGQFNGQLFTLFLAFTVTHFTGVNPWKLKLDRGDTDALVGSSFNVTCTLNPVFAASSKTNSSNLVIAFEYIGIGEYIPIEKYFIRVIDGNSIQLQYPRLLPEFVNTLQYVTCYRNNNIRDAASLSLKVKERHRIQPRVTPLYVDNWEQLCLGWEAEKETERYFPLVYQTWYRNEISTTVFSRIENCVEKRCKLPDPYRLALPGDVLIVKVNGSARTVYSEGILETVTSDEVRVNLIEYLRPRKVEHIDVIQDQSNKTLVFQPPKTNRLIRYDINVTCNKHSFVKALNITCLVTDIATHSDQNSQNTSVVEPLVGLPPYSNCTVSVRAISVNGGNWSEWRHHNFQTLQDVPLAVPRSCTSCFQVKEEGNSAFFDIIVYFTPLSEEEARGRVEGYKIRKFQNDDVIPKVMELSSDSLYSSSFLLSNLSNGSDYKISIEAKTQKGYNETLNLSSIIRVPESKYRTQPVSYKFTVVILNETAVRTTWEMKRRTDIEKIFLFWCNGNVENYRPCKKPLNWKEILFTFNSSATYIINLDNGESSNGYIFGTGIERNGKSSGITWNICTYDIKDAPPKPHIGNFKSTSSAISFPLFESSCERFGPERGFIIGYRVFLCPVPSSNSSERKCLEDARSLDFNGSHDVLNLNDLRSNQSYRVVIQSLSETRTSENVTYDVTTFAANSSSSSALISAIVGAFIIASIPGVLIIHFKQVSFRRYLNEFRFFTVVVPPTVKRPTPVPQRTGDVGYQHHLIGKVNYFGTIVESSSTADSSFQGSVPETPPLSHSALSVIPFAVSESLRSDSGMEINTPVENILPLLTGNVPSSSLEDYSISYPGVIGEDGRILEVSSRCNTRKPSCVGLSVLPLITSNGSSLSSPDVVRAYSGCSSFSHIPQSFSGSGYARCQQDTPTIIFPAPPGKAKPVILSSLGSQSSSSIADESSSCSSVSDEELVLYRLNSHYCSTPQTFPVGLEAVALDGGSQPEHNHSAETEVPSQNVLTVNDYSSAMLSQSS